jgi:hypothetical protein
MLIKQTLSQVIASTNASVSVQLPITVNAVAASFMKIADERVYDKNNLNLQQPVGISKLYYQFNNSGKYIAYPLESVQDMLQHYLDGIHANDAVCGRVDDGKNDFTLEKLNFSEVFGVGVDFTDNLSLANAPMTLSLVSEVKSTDPYRIWLYLMTLLAL